MSKTSLTILCVVIAAIITGMILEVPALSNGTGAFLVMALIYSFVVAKREAGLIAYALEHRQQAEDVRFREEVIVPEWLQKVPGASSPVPAR